MSGFKKSLYGLVMFVLLISSLIFLKSGVAKALPNTFTVTNTNDSGSGSLRQAIEDANNNSNPNDMDIIEFDISGSNVHTITPQTALPPIIEKVTIDGYTQTGASPNTTISPQPMDSVIKIEVDGSAISGFQEGLYISADDSVIKGLSIHSFSHSEILIEAPSVAIVGSYLGVPADGLTILSTANECAIRAESNAGFATIGGLDAGERNILADSSSICLNGGDSEVYGNYIGIGRDGITDLDIDIGLGLGGEGHNIIGSPLSGGRNVISGASAPQFVFQFSDENIIQNNIIGGDYTGAANPAITNGISGMSVQANNNLIGGTGQNEGNIVVAVGGTGIGLAAYSAPAVQFEIVPEGNSILGNSISGITISDYLSFGNSNLGIDILTAIAGNAPDDFNPTEWSEQGPTKNDVGDADTGPQNYINTPVLKSAQQIGNQLTINYDLDVSDSPDNSYRVEFFVNDESTIFGYGPGQTFIGSASVSPGENKTVTLTVSSDITNKSISSTATAIDSTANYGFGSTSEFSQNISIGSATDFDSDGSPDLIEQQAPNNGDGNNDGIQDYLQPTVTTFEIDHTGIFETLVTTGCSENGTVASIDASSLSVSDNGKAYPYGLTDFVLNCSRGDTVTVTKYVFVNTPPDSFTVRKYIKDTKAYINVPNSSITSQTVGNTKALIATYSIADGGELDDDKSANGVIVDPVGLAVASIGVPNTGLGKQVKHQGYKLYIFFIVIFVSSLTVLIKRKSSV